MEKSDMAHTVDRNYQSKARKPADFNAFWEDVLEDAAKVPLEPEAVPEALRSSDDIEVFQVFYNSLDNVRIAGWYCLPRERKGPLPAVMVVPGYQSDPPITKEWARRGYATLSVAPRGKLRSNRQFNPGYPGLLTYGIVDRNAYSYRGFYVDAWRGIDFLLSRDEVDSSRIGVTGSSQGGGLTITTAAMRPEVRAAAAGAPYLTGFLDSIELTHTYPYEEINDYLRLHPDSRGEVEETLNYFDGINFADRITCPIIVNVGLQDNVCPPETGFALFDKIGSADKRMYPYDGQGHSAGRAEHGPVIEAFFAKHLA
ncbi:MAG: acetylxylan esterase [SAR202 cluster bacterium]|jgi:cephalosporin-C deacetylase|nr:acetylxylan esterase [SAR202 cluster bacterium]MDP7102452.1 acetylxylan esterase [SAR202 cluster bacterium]MDP7224860.1 acetylxylan esterase [SAR202 cluster bacterium]HJO82986.1 acetylxylan esterase [SAR202 cluster bacterium]|tara:strand:- start:154 stop:1092 length:939 start_codon:yes stop_codon:yes gene_type:complete